MTLNRVKQDKTWFIDIAFLILALGSLLFILLGSRPLFVPDEGRYAEIAREMVASGDYVTPYLNHIKYFEKPVLFYWLESAAIKIGGLNLWSLRSVNALLGLIGCLLTYATARKLYDRTTGLLSALILGTSTLYFIMAHMISLDLPVTVFLMLSLYAFLLGTEEPIALKRRLYLWVAASSAALAVLTKGLIGIVFPFIIIGSWIAIMNEWRLLKRLYLPSSLLIFFLLATPWHWLVSARNAEFFDFYFIEQHFLRYTTMDIGHYQPIWFFIPNLILGFFPWIVFLPQAIYALLPFSKRRVNKTELFFLLWALLIFVFFSLSKSKLIPYILPIFPPLAILTARYLRKAFLQRPTLGFKISYLILLLLTATIAVTFYALTHLIDIPNPKTANFYLYSAATCLFLGMIIATYYAYHSVRPAILTTITTMFLFLLLLIGAMPYIDTRSVAPFGSLLKPLLKPDDEIITFNQYYQDLPFYIERRITILNWRNELSFGMQHQDTTGWMIDNETFWERWQGKGRVFVVIDIKGYEHLVKTYPQMVFHLLGQTSNNALISNQRI